MTLEERVRYQIGVEAPQLSVGEHERWVEDVLETMTAGELLKRISWELEERGLHFADK